MTPRSRITKICGAGAERWHTQDIVCHEANSDQPLGSSVLDIASMRHPSAG